MKKKYPDFFTNLIEILALASSARLYFKNAVQNVV